MVVLSKLVLTTAVVVPALAFDVSHIRFGHPVHMLHEKVKAQQAFAAPQTLDTSGTQHLGQRHVQERKVPTGFSEDGIVKHHLHHSQDVLEPRDATAADSTASGAVDTAADSSASADTGATGAGGAPDPAHEAHKDATANDATAQDAAHDPASPEPPATPATPATPVHAVNAAAVAPPASQSSSAAAATNTQKVTPHKPQPQNNDFFGGLLKLIFHEPNHVDKALSNGWNAMGKLFTGEPSKNGAAAPAASQHHRRFEVEDAEELFERDLPEEDLELFERDLPEEDLELFERSFPEDVEELEARDFDEELEQLAARAFDDELELEARDFDDELELEARDFDDELELEARDFDDLEDLE